jgi:hypothetical protein
MERHSNPLPQIVLHELDVDQGDFLDGLIANDEILRARQSDSPVAPEYKEEILIFSSSENALETIGADNFRGFNLKPDEIGIDNFRAKVEA